MATNPRPRGGGLFLALLLNLKFHPVQARFSQVSAATALGRGPAGAPVGRRASQVWGPDQWRVEICLEPTICFPPLLFSLENVLFCEISKSVLCSAPRLRVG